MSLNNDYKHFLTFSIQILVFKTRPHSLYFVSTFKPLTCQYIISLPEVGVTPVTVGVTEESHWKEQSPEHFVGMSLIYN